MDHLRSGVWDHPGRHGEISSLLKYKKLAGRGSMRLIVSATQEAEAGEALDPRKQSLQ